MRIIEVIKAMLLNIMHNKVPAFGLLTLAVYLVTFALFKTNDILWSYADMKNYMRLGLACVTGGIATYAIEMIVAVLFNMELNVSFRMNIMLEDFKAYGQKVIEDLNAYAITKEGWSLASDNFEGVRVNLDAQKGNGWFLLRLSLHDPLLPLNIESNDVGGAKKIATELAEFIKAYDKLDAKSLLDFAK